MNPTLASTATDLNKRSSKDYRVKNNRGSMLNSQTTSNWRSQSHNKERSPENEHNLNNISDYHTTSIEHIDLLSSGKSQKTPKVL